MSVSPSSLQPKSKFRVAICGAGISGLVLAITIGKCDPSIPIDLYEAHDSIDTAGVGITLPRSEILVELGLFEEFKQIFTHDPDSAHGFNIRRSDIPEGGYIWYQRIHTNHGACVMHRQQMITILEKNLPVSCTVHSRKRLVNYTEPEKHGVSPTLPITLEFEDGTTAIADVLIGADGIRSVVRKTMFEAASKDQDVGNEIELKQHIEPIFTGMTVYRCLIPAETLRKQSPENVALTEMMLWQGKGRSCITYPIAKGAFINFAATFCDPSLMGTRYEGHWVSDVTHEKLVESFDDFEPDLRAIVKLCEKPSKWALHVVNGLPFCVRKRVALIGDACHAMTPHFGAGAAQAMEVALILGRLIAHALTSLSRIPDVLRIYGEVRLAPTRDMVDLAWSAGRLYTFMEPGYYDGTRKKDDLDDKGIGASERDGMEVLKQEIHRRWEWFEGLGSVLQTWEEAKSKLEALVN